MKQKFSFSFFFFLFFFHFSFFIFFLFFFLKCPVIIDLSIQHKMKYYLIYKWAKKNKKNFLKKSKKNTMNFIIKYSLQKPSTPNKQHSNHQKSSHKTPTGQRNKATTTGHKGKK
ncbi:hypothetical protein M0811_00592 [Anaeramoeba ignava]|uniref:Uncharacterized protein n=1 Tax=Anaeramoeba ignava TaxID=1746090 RepID=A0A9Q0LQT4_ANAIG|nr:hypothetical protein M0811_00592 [Anaeramoeba ignava]